ncbi:Uncharacterised protein [Enterobacter cloacae]|nr:Uncharacterised protein [Enterobacter cloacae]
MRNADIVFIQLLPELPGLAVAVGPARNGIILPPGIRGLRGVNVVGQHQRQAGKMESKEIIQRSRVKQCGQVPDALTNLPGLLAPRFTF